MINISANNHRHPVTKTFTPLHYTTSHLNFTHLHFTTISFGLTQFKFPTASFHLTSLHFTSIHFTSLHFQTIFATLLFLSLHPFIIAVLTLFLKILSLHTRTEIPYTPPCQTSTYPQGFFMGYTSFCCSHCVRQTRLLSTAGRYISLKTGTHIVPET